ncbi:MAG: gliding motility-associated C-terminal domain-containing protein [Flavobacteriaceae bacterium]|nr:gliding motility-associated C-terminal domain-containing protein [Flavobacteriaceae bacterium]
MLATPDATIANNNGLALSCSIPNTTLTASGGVSYSWLNGSTVVGTSAGLLVNTAGTFTVTVTGANGCTATAFVQVIFNQDNTPPSIACPSDISVFGTSAAGAVVNFSSPIGTDNCPGASTQQTGGLASGSVFPYGTSVVTFTVTDSSELTASCSFTVTVLTTPIDAINDVAGPISGLAGGNAGINVLSNDTLNGSIVNPSAVTITPNTVGPLTVNADGSVSVAANTPAGVYNISYTVCENNNPSNCDSAVVSVTVSAPIIDAVDNTINVGNNGTNGNPNLGNILNNDTVNGGGATNTNVILTVVTPATPINGGAVPVVDVNTGIVSLPAGTPAGTYTIVYEICGILNPGNCDTAVVTVIVTAAVIDAVNDVFNTVSCSSSTIIGSLLTNDTLNGVTVSANLVTLSILSGANSNISINTTNGNISITSGIAKGSYVYTYQICEKLNPTNCDTASITINITDTTLPIAVCKSITVQLNEQGVATITPSMIDGGSSDSCGPVTLTASKTSFSCANVGTNNITLTVTDASGNIATCVAVVTIVDKVAPTVFCRNITVDLDQNNVAVITAQDIDNGSFDACGIASYSIDVNTFGFEDLGDNPVVLTVTDVNGNVSTCTAIVTVGSVGGVAACLTIFNEFTPNDDGYNDYFYIKCVELYPNNKLEVYNRWGHKVYEKQGYNNNWDGTANTGNVINRKEKLPVGTYYYVFNLGDDTPAFSGWLYIQR